MNKFKTWYETYNVPISLFSIWLALVLLTTGWLLIGFILSIITFVFAMIGIAL